MDKPRILIDVRERKLMDVLEKMKETIEFEAKRLDVADIIISEDVAIERKEGFDFISSIMDNRLFEQLLRLTDVYKYPILLLEGLNDSTFKNTGMNIKSIYGALAFCSYKLGVSVIPTRNIEDSAIVVERIAYREQVQDNKPILSRKAPKNMSPEERMTFIIEGLVDIGPTKAKTLIDTFKSPYQVFKAIKNTEIIYTRNNRPKGIKGPLERLRGFGWKFIEKNQSILFGVNKKKPQKKINDF